MKAVILAGGLGTRISEETHFSASRSWTLGRPR
jgi:NDP-sugar pyrophosphorylase family protein